MWKKKERKFNGVWNAERILYGYIYNTDNDGFLPDLEKFGDSTRKISMQRFYAAMRAYGKDPKWFYKPEKKTDGYWCHDYENSRRLLTHSRKEDKMTEFRELVKPQLFGRFHTEFVDSPNFVKYDVDIYLIFRYLMKYRKALFAAQDVWSDMLESSRTVGTIHEVTMFLSRKHIVPICKVVDRMLILLMGDDYDRSFTEEELFEYGYPNVTDDELYQMELKEW